MSAAVEEVIRTTTKVLEGELSGREAVTILATLARDAVPAASELRKADPDRADTYRELISAIGEELQSRIETDSQPRHLQAVIDDLTKVRRSLD